MSERLQQSLLALDPTGANGFEGVVRDALSEITGRAFGLLKSGPQGGVDGINGPIANRLVIGFEAKRYKETNRLPADELVAKLHDTARNYPSLDLWILAATRSISAGDAATIHTVGEELGIDVLILDWAGGANPPAIVDLIAAAPNSAAHHFGGDKTLIAELDKVRQQPGFETRLAMLHERLSQPEIGLATARERCRAYLTQHMSDRDAARLVFNSHAALRADGVKRINRDGLNTAIENWWLSSYDSPLVLLGREGVGKTWEALGWWLGAAAADPEFPLTLVLPARDVIGIDGPALIATFLRKATGVRDDIFWRRRLDRWATVETDRPLMLIVIDGLNQNWTFGEWADLILSLSTPEWRGKIAIILTCRPDHWHNRLAELPGLPRPAIPVPVNNFNDEELDALLDLYELKRSDFDEPMLALLRVPRLCHIAIERRADLQKSGDVTVERLVYEDWRHRRPQARQSLSHEEFRRFVAELGRDAEGRLDGMDLSRAELLARLSSGDGREPGQFEHVLSELIDGNWLIPATGRNRFKLAPDRAPAALGLTLVADLRGASDAGEIEQRMAAVLDPLQGMDFSVAILRHAATFALLDSTLERPVVSALIEAWLGSQNSTNEDFQSFWRLIGCDTELILDIAERHWFHRDGEGRIDEYINKGFCNAFRWPDVAGPLTERLVRWFSAYWLDPLATEFGGQLADDDEAQQRRARSEMRALQAEEERLAQRFGLTIVRVEPGNQGWGCARAVELLSWLPRASLLDAYTAWAITRAIMGRGTERTMAWNLRWFLDTEHEGDVDLAPPMIIDRARELGKAGAIGRDAARRLLEGLATPEAHRFLAIDLVSGNAVPDAAQLPCEPEPRTVEWPEAPSTPRFENGSLEAVRLLSADPFDPDCQLPGEMVSRLKAAADAMSDEQLQKEMPGTDGGFEYARPALARWAPGKLAELLNRRYRPPPPVATAKRGIIDRITALFGRRKVEEKPVLPSDVGIEAEMLAFDDATINAWARLASEPELLADRQAAYVVPLVEASAATQIRLLEAICPDGKLPNWSGIILAPPGEAELETIAAHLDPAGDAATLRFWMRYLYRVHDLQLPAGWAPLLPMIIHDDPLVRAAAFRLIQATKDRVLADAIVASGWKASGAEHREEAAHGSLALIWSSAAIAGTAVPLVHPDALGELSHIYPACRTYVDAFADHVRDELHFIRTARSRSYPRSLLHVDNGWDELLAHHGAAFRTWIEPFFELGTSEAFHLFGFCEPFPLLGALKAYDGLKPGSQARLLETALDTGNHGTIRFGDLYRQAAELQGPSGARARELALAEANDDQKLHNFAITVQRSGETAWLINLIERDLEAQTAWTIARAITLAGFLAPDDAGEALWQGKLATPPAPGWLAKTWEKSRHHFERGRRNRHWCNRYLEAESDIEAFAAFELFSGGIDRRMVLDRSNWLEPLRALPLRRRLHWDIVSQGFQAAFEKTGKGLANNFLHTEPPLSGQAPRMR
jgi:hypothetical protein